jgi:TolB protein
MRRFSTLVAGGALVCCAAYLAHAQTAPPAGDDTVRFKISAGGKDLYKIAVPLPIGISGAPGQAVADQLNNDLSLSGYFKVIDSKATLANLAAEGLTINAQDWRNVGAEGVSKCRVTPSGSNARLECRLYEVTRGDQPVLTKDFSVGNLRSLVHQWAAEIVRYYTGEDAFFNSRIVFSQTQGKMRRDLFVMDWDGAGLYPITRSSENVIPSWSPNATEILFTSYMTGSSVLYAMPSNANGKPRVISARPGLNMGAAFSPDGTKIAATLSQDGNSEIYLLSRDGAIIKRLTNNTFIDTSPTWSPDGSKIAFVSDRFGSPQIWTMNADGSNQQRLTRRGNYNQTPRWCPRKDVSLIAFTARDEKYNYDIFTINPDTGEMIRITEGHGSNQNPSWAPNGRALAYESSRGGVWVSTFDGRTERQVYKGNATYASWSPLLPPLGTGH